MYSNKYLENATEISSVEGFISQINFLKANQDGKMQLFFRGQSVDYWDIKPSIFRKEMLSIEHDLMAEPIRIIPKEFRNLGDTFEIMEKYQHYGLSTRLLDLTSNPLVALYFACEKNEKYDRDEEYSYEDGSVEKRRPNGVIYIKSTETIKRYDDIVIRIIAYLAKSDLSEEISLRILLKKLREDNIITTEFSEEGHINRLIELLQDSYVVQPVINNERLLRQSGAFLLPGKFNIKFAGKNIIDAIIEKAECDLRSEFDDYVLYVSDENKEKIREELNNYNINGASLFPELEYQLRSIQKDYEVYKKTVASFEKYTDYIYEGSTQRCYAEDTQNVDINESVTRIIEESQLDASLVGEIIKIFKENQTIDWYKRQSVISRIKVEIIKLLMNNKCDKAVAELLSEKILEAINVKK